MRLSFPLRNIGFSLVPNAHLVMVNLECSSLSPQALMDLSCTIGEAV